MKKNAAMLSIIALIITTALLTGCGSTSSFNDCEVECEDLNYECGYYHPYTPCTKEQRTVCFNECKGLTKDDNNIS